MTTTLILLTTGFIIVIALIIAAAAGKIARLDGATYPTALTHAAIAFTTSLTLVIAAASTYTALLR